MHFLTLRDITPAQLNDLVEIGISIANGNIPSWARLDGKMVGQFFRGPSTRTRTSFSVGAMKLGASIIQYGPLDLQITTGESPQDTGRILAQYLDALVVRTNGPDAEMLAFAEQEQMAVINAMSASEHPTQALADLITVQEITGALTGRHIVYMGEGNNTAAALALAVSLTPGMRLTLMTPERYRLNSDIRAFAEKRARVQQSEIAEFHDMSRLPSSADVVYTTRWQTMGVTHDDPDWLENFRPFKVTQEILGRLDNGHTIFMHDLPAVRGQDCDDEVLDGPRSAAFRQSWHKLNAAMALLAYVIWRR